MTGPRIKKGSGEPKAPRARRTTLLGMPASPFGSPDGKHSDESGFHTEQDRPGHSAVPSPSQRPSGTSPLSSRSMAGLAWIQDEHPSILLVGEGHPMQEALGVALGRHRLESESSSVSTVLSAVVAATPKLVLILGDAAQGSGSAVLGALRSAELDDVVPIVVLLDDTSLAARLEAIRQGAAAVIPRSASVDEIAHRLAQIAHAANIDQVRAEFLGEASLSDLLEEVGQRIVTRVLPSAVGTEAKSVRVTLGAGREVAGAVDETGQKLASKIIRAEHVGGDLLREGSSPELTSPIAGSAQRKGISGLRIAIADDDSGRADEMAAELRQHGATVILTGFAPLDARIRRIRQVDPMVLIMRSADLEGNGHALLERMKADLRLRWMTLVVTDWSGENSLLDAGQVIERLLDQILLSGEPDRALQAAAEAGSELELRLESLGPARALRAASACSQALRMTVQNPRLEVLVEFSEGLLVGARATVQDASAEVLEGPAALSALLMLGSGKLTVTPTQSPRMLNIMSTVGTALDLAETEPRAVAPSVPPLLPTPVGLPQETTRQVVGFRALRLGDLRSRASRGLRSRQARPFLWAAAFGMIIAAVVVTLFAVRARRSRAGAAVASATPAPATRPSSTSSPLERARLGDPAAMASIETRPISERSIEDAKALAEGRIAHRIGDVEALAAQCADKPDLLKQPKISGQWISYAQDDTIATEALTALADLPSATAADLIYAVWVGTNGHTSATQLAKDLLYTEAVRSRGTPALSALLEMRAATDCQKMKEILPRAAQVADRRALRILGKLPTQRNCGPSKHELCFPCLRGSDLVAKAVRAVRVRPAPRFPGE